MIPSPPGAAERVQSTAFAEIAASRRSVRRFAEQEVAEASLQRILAAATSAPSAHNRQPWRFAVIEGRQAKRALATAMAGRLREDRLRSGEDPGEVAADAARSIARVGGAPLLIVVCLTMEDMDVYGDPARDAAELLMAVQSVAMAMQNALLAAHDEGLGACVMCAPLFCPDDVREVLGLPGAWRPQGLLTIGHPTGGGRLRPRRPVSAVTIRVSEPAGLQAESVRS